MLRLAPTVFLVSSLLTNAPMWWHELILHCLKFNITHYIRLSVVSHGSPMQIITSLKEEFMVSVAGNSISITCRRERAPASAENPFIIHPTKLDLIGFFL